MQQGFKEQMILEKSINRLEISLNQLKTEEEKFWYEQSRQIIFEGDHVTIGGFLCYNFAYDAFEINNVEIITGSGKENLIQYFNDMKRSYGKYFTVFAGITLIFVGLGTYYLLKHYKNNYQKFERTKYKEEIRLVEDVPDDECCIVCMVSRRDIVLLPCNHLILCRFCFQEIQEKCPHCNTKIENHAVLNFRKHKIN